MKQREFENAVLRILGDDATMLIDKNMRYGDAALRPLGVFGSPDPEQGIRQRIDDKLKRIQTSEPGEQEDVIRDLRGYLVLLEIAQIQKRGIPENIDPEARG